MSYIGTILLRLFLNLICLIVYPLMYRTVCQKCFPSLLLTYHNAYILFQVLERSSLSPIFGSSASIEFCSASSS